MARQHMMTLRFCGTFAAIGIAVVSLQVRAADLDGGYPSGPAVVAGAAGQALDPRCRIVPMPETNLYGDTTRFRPTIVCMSRGLYADFNKPFPVYRPYYSQWIGDFNPFR